MKRYILSLIKRAPDIWKHGKYVDTWSLVHFLSGALLGSLFYFWGFSFVSSAALSFLVLVAWEIFEAVAKIIEPSANVAVDLFVGLAGSSVALCAHFYLGYAFDSAVFASILTFTLVLSVWGFTDFLRKGYR